MCGIAGIVNWGNREVLDRMVEIQAHRGPDDHGIWEHYTSDGTYWGMGSRRLAILDLSRSGHMPMPNEQKNIWITYNGEIYNFPELREDLLKKGHIFFSNTDTEVVLHLYEQEGINCVNLLNGMFSFTICDLRSSSPKLFLARDHFGIKPFYYIHRGDKFAFSSEVKALFNLPDLEAEMDIEALHQYLTFLWVPDPKTMFKNIFKLPAGHYAVFQNGNLKIVQYWDITFPEVNKQYSLSKTELVEALRAHFRRSVRAQMISDVPIGAFLSSGIDSSSIVAMMSKATNKQIRTYTITFPTKYRTGETTLDNPVIAREMAQKFGFEHNEIVVEPQVSDLLPKLIWHMDEPVADPAIITAYLVCHEAHKRTTVLLSGIGGDELFAGYRKHYAYYWAKIYRLIPSLLRRNFIEPLVLGLPTMRGTSLKGLVRLAKKMVRSGSLSPQNAFLRNCTYLDESQKKCLYTVDLKSKLDAIDPWELHCKYFERIAHADFLNQMLYLDQKAFMVSLNLTYNDKMSMASSVEVRVPFLDRELAEFAAWHIPPRLKLNGLIRPTTKYIFREAMKGILPSAVLRQPKAGFGAPVDYWMADDLKEMVDDLLSESNIKKRGLFQPKAVSQLINEQRNGEEDWSMQIWQLLTLEVWLETFIDKT